MALGLPFVLIAACTEPSPPGSALSFQHQGPESGIDGRSTTYSIAVSDFDGDADEDLLIGNHGSSPTLYLNTGKDGRFVDKSGLLGIVKRGDRHGFTVVDIDNDGDRDFLYAGGGADGVGRGLPNGIYRNLLVQSGHLGFEEAAQASDTGPRTMRARHFFPIPSASGEHVNFYLTALHKRRESSNLYIDNKSDAGAIRLIAKPDSPYNRRYESEGKDLFFDFDRDGLIDYLRVGYAGLRLLRNDGRTFVHFPSALDGLRNVVSAVAADFNNDGFPDLYLGTSSEKSLFESAPDHISHDGSRIQFSLARQFGDRHDAIVVDSTSPQLSINFVYHSPQLARMQADPADIYIGAKGVNPARRKTIITAQQAEGRPQSMDMPGTYIWHDAASGQWHVQWRHGNGKRLRHKGVIELESIERFTLSGFEQPPVKRVHDYLLLNEQGKNWKRISAAMLEHERSTNYLTAVDFNNDGLVDIAGTRSGGEAQANGTPFILVNRGDWRFTSQSLPPVDAERIYRGDIIVHGFFNADRLPDIFYSNGHGLKPLASGPYSLWLNTTVTSHDALLLALEGTRANRDAIGAQLELFDAEGTLLGYRELGANFGRGQASHLVHFGLGDTEAPYLLRILWPGTGQPQELSFDSGGLHRIRQ